MPNLLSPRLILTQLHSRVAKNPARLRAAFLTVLAIVVVSMSLKYAAKVAKPADDGRQTRSAFLRWRGMIHDLFAGENIYIGKNEYPNPPIMAAVLRPFAELPPLTGALAWFYAKVLMTTLAVLWAFRLIAPVAGTSGTDNPMSDAAKALAVLLALPPLLGDLSHNNVNIFILFLVAACLEAYRRGWDIAAGLSLGLAIACKVTPLLFVGYFVWKRSGRVLVGCGVGLVLWLLIVPGIAYGWSRNLELLESWSALMLKPAIVENRVTSEHPNQSIPGVVFRLLTHSPSFIEYDKTPDGDIPRAAEFHNLADIGPDVARAIVKGCLVGFALLIVLLCRTPRGTRQGVRFTAECALIVLGMLLFSERTWKHHAVTLIYPFAAICCVLFTTRPAFATAGLKRVLALILVAVAVLTVGTGALADRAADLAMVYGTYTAAFLLLTFGTVLVLASTPKSCPIAPETSETDYFSATHTSLEPSRA